MTSEEKIAQQQSLLETHRRTLFIYLQQHAAHGAAYTPPGIINGIFDARNHIRYIKQTLRDWGISVEDQPYDEDISQFHYEQTVPNLFNVRRTVTILPNTGPTLIATSLNTPLLSGTSSPLTNTVFVANDKGIYRCAENGEATFEMWGEVINGLSQTIYKIGGSVSLYDDQDNQIPIALSNLVIFMGNTNFIESGGRRPFRFVYKASATLLPPIRHYEVVDLRYLPDGNMNSVILPFKVDKEGYNIVVANPYANAVDNPGVIATVYNDDGTVVNARFGMSSGCPVIYPGYSCTMGLLLSGEGGKAFNAIALGKLRQ